MQFAKEEIRRNIIEAARREFLSKGFEKSSIRTIAANAHTAKSNIYNYFRDKDALFCAVLEPTLSKVRAGLELARLQSTTLDVGARGWESQRSNIRVVMDFVFEHVSDVKLLLFSAGGSSLEGFREIIIEQFTDMLLVWLRRAVPGKSISRFFVSTVSDFYLSTIERMLLEGVCEEKANQHFSEFVTFVYSGWSGVLK